MMKGFKTRKKATTDSNALNVDNDCIRNFIFRLQHPNRHDQV